MPMNTPGFIKTKTICPICNGEEINIAQCRKCRVIFRIKPDLKNEKSIILEDMKTKVIYRVKKKDIYSSK